MNLTKTLKIVGLRDFQLHPLHVEGLGEENGLFVSFSALTEKDKLLRTRRPRSPFHFPVMLYGRASLLVAHFLLGCGAVRNLITGEPLVSCR